ncbi:MAG: tagatose 1,6-diphosphate aldolase [Chloroflexota bacterium]
MTTQLTPGRYRGLKVSSLAEQDVFGILAFDQRGSYKRMMPEDTDYKTLVQVKIDIIGTLSKYASAVLTDPTYGLSPAMQMSGQSGLLLSLEKSGYDGDPTERTIVFDEDWTIEKIRKMGASAVKLLVYYNPQNEALADELDVVVTQTIADCHAWDLPVFLEPLSYSIDANVPSDSAEFAEQRPGVVVETARRLCKTGADVLKMEFPINIKYNDDRDAWRSSCAALSEASTVPWVLLSAGVDFERFVPQVEIACESGASGFLAGRAIWKEGATMSPADRIAFLKDTATERLKQLLEIAAAKSKPWTDFYGSPQSTSDWYENYT